MIFLTGYSGIGRGPGLSLSSLCQHDTKLRDQIHPLKALSSGCGSGNPMWGIPSLQEKIQLKKHMWVYLLSLFISANKKIGNNDFIFFKEKRALYFIKDIFQFGHFLKNSVSFSKETGDQIKRLHLIDWMWTFYTVYILGQQALSSCFLLCLTGLIWFMSHFGRTLWAARKESNASKL